MSTQAPVVCAYDGSAQARRAVGWAAAEAARREAPLRIVTYLNWPPAAAAATAARTYLPDDRHRLRAAKAALGDAADHARAVASDVEVNTHVHPEAVVPALLREAQGAAVLVLGARGVGGFARMLLGSTSTAVAEHAACPVVVVRPGADRESEPGPFAGRVVVGIDGSPASEPAVGFAIEAAAARGVGLVAVTALNLDAFAQSLGTVPIESMHPDRLLEVAATTLEDSLAPWQSKFPEVEVTRELRQGHPVAALVETTGGAELLVVGTRGRSGLKAALLGSVSRGVLHHADCPVAVVPAPRAT